MLSENNFKGLSISRIKYLFSVGSKKYLDTENTEDMDKKSPCNSVSKTSIFKIHNGALIPPIGRFLSKRIPSIYFLVQAVLPFCVGQKVVVLRKM
ncbi:MAG: hypothetical protein V1833_03245 [Elusimicrobiota bacterium]